MWYRTAQQGVMNLDRIFQGAEQTIISWVKNSLIDGDLPNAPQEYRGKYNLENLEVPEILKKFINNIEFATYEGALGKYSPTTKILTIPASIDKKQINNLLSTILHEIRHGIDPRYNNTNLIQKYNQQYYSPNLLKTKMFEFFKTNNKIPSFEETISHIILESDSDPNNPDIRKIFEKGFTKSAYDIALQSILNKKDLYLNNPIEHSSQLGDIARLLSKENLDAVREYIKKNQNSNLSDDQLRILLKNGLNPKSRNFEAFSQILQQVSGNQANSLSTIVKSIKDPKWQEQYLKQVSNAVSVYNKDNGFKGLVRRENLVQPGIKSNPKFNLEDNSNAMKSRSAFFSKAAQIELLAEKNPKAWSRFINSNFAMRMISNKFLNVFKTIGTGSKSLSQSIKGLNMNSPLWALLEPALEFGLYQFGLYLENPNGNSLETPGQKTIRELDAQINTIIADPKIRDKRGYFIQNYGSYLKTLGSMEQNSLLGKFPVMGYNNFMNVGKNIGQR